MFVSVFVKVKEQTKNTTVGKKRGQKCLPQKSSMKKAEQSLLSKLEKQVQVAETQQAQKTTAVFEPLVRYILNVF